MRRIAIGLVVFATAMAMTLPATAAKPPKPPKTPDYSYYTLEITSSELSSTCGTPIVVRQDGPHFEWFYNEGDTELPEDMELHLATPGLSWNSEPVSGCQNAGAVETLLLNGDVESSPANGYFRITLEDDGTVAILWIFDIYEQYEEVEVQKNRKRTTVKLVLTEPRTDYRMGGPYVVDEYGDPIAEFAVGQWSEEDGVITGTVEGAFSFVHYESGGDPLFTLLTNAVHEFGIHFTLTPYEPPT